MAAGNQVLPEAPVAAGRAPARTRRGSGGRWLVWGLRGVVWVVLLLIGYRGIAAIVTGPSQPVSGGVGSASPADRGFPVTLAQAFALEFGQAYLNFSPATAAKRGTELAGFLPPGADPQLGWSGAGTQSLQSEQAAGVRVQDAHHAIVTLLARVDGKLIELGVPVYSADGGLVVSGLPALLPAPAQIAPPAPHAGATDPATEATLTRQLGPFFRAFASGDKLTLRPFLVDGAQVTGLDGTVGFSSIVQVSVPASQSATRDITVTIVWRLATQAPALPGSPVAVVPAQIEMAYAMTVVRRGGSWYVQSIGASSALPGPPS